VRHDADAYHLRRARAREREQEQEAPQRPLVLPTAELAGW
jgi:hypothetical protein